MARRAFVHIGTPKSGTTYLQSLWWQHRDALAERGLLLPGGDADVQFHAAAVVRAAPESVPPETLVIHGELDDTVPLADVFDWARPLELPIVVVPGADHFFHRRLPLIKRLVSEAVGSAQLPGWH